MVIGLRFHGRVMLHPTWWFFAASILLINTFVCLQLVWTGR
jgi:hypothetical protein